MPAPARAFAATTLAVEAVLVKVEVDLSSQLPAVSTVGLAQSEVKEGKDRVRAAIRNSGITYPARKVTINLAPADLPKTGTAFDLPIAVAMLAAAERVSPARLGEWVLVGELALDGSVRPVPGILPIAIAARRAGMRGVIVAPENGEEAAAVDGIEVAVASSLGEVLAFLDGHESLRRVRVDLGARLRATGDAGGELALVRGHALARRALEVAAAGGHNLLMSGPPGTGKTMLARCLPSILPPLTPEEALEVTAVHSVAGILPTGGLVTQRPFRSPHPSCRPQALVGGGQPLRPGEVSLAHRGVLFLDEFPELHRDVLEALRGPLEDREIHIARAGRRMRFPASFTLIAAMNPCPCGLAGTGPCDCPKTKVDQYIARISGPLLDRIDLFVRLDALRGEEFDGPPPESSAAVRSRVIAARERALARIAAEGHTKAACNADVPTGAIDAALSALSRKMLGDKVDRGMSGRARDRALRIARTLADLEGCADVSEDHLGEATAFRPLKELL